MNLSISHYTATGKRDNNEDAHALVESETSLLAVVADGLGGHDDGEVASNQAVSTLKRLAWSKQPDDDTLTDAIQQASREIFEMQKPEHPMRSTVAALWLGDEGTVAAHVGDSRIYQFRDGKIIYQSMDHSVAQMAVLVGELDKDDIRSSKDRNKLIRVLGNDETPKVDSRELYVEAGDRFLLCTDGFWEAVTEEDMLRTMEQEETVQQWLAQMRKIVSEAQNPKQDNHTAIAIIVNGLR